MNCLGTRRDRYEFNLAEPSAPPYYPPQLPYNPDFIDESIGHDTSSILEATYIWSICENACYIGNTFESYGEWGRARRSLYEGVNCVPVSAPGGRLCASRHALPQNN